MRKKFTLLLTIILVLAAFMPPVNAAMPGTDQISVKPVLVDNSGPEKTYVYFDYAFSSINIDYRGCASIYNKTACRSCVDKIIISSYIQRYDNGWKTVKHWRETTYSNRATMSHYWFVSEGYTYRVRTYFYAYDGTDLESTTCTDTEYY